VTIVGLYTNVPSGGHLEQTQIDWLTGELRDADPKLPLIVCLHHPPYSVDAGTDTPAGHWNRIALELVASGRLSMQRTARLLATLNTAQADAFVAAWDAKFTYWSMRPVTAMRRYVDRGWTPFLPTPPFLGYVSGHSTTSAAASLVLARFFPSRASDLDHMANEAAVSRLYAGIHFRTDNDAGLELGRRVGKAALKRFSDH
jgi:membrane-associated phospholipid phosphatase